MNLWARRQGFTIVELLIVVVVIAILAAIVIVAYSGIQDRARQSAAQASLSSAQTKIKTYMVTNGSLPPDMAALNIANTDVVSYQYTLNDQFTPNTYCLTTTAGKYSYHASTGGTKTDGPCPNHTGNAPAPLDCPTGFVTVPGNSLFNTQAFCVMKYEAKDGGGSVAVSAAAGAPWVSMTQPDARTMASGACEDCHLMTLDEWLTIAHNLMNVASNWSGGAVGAGAVFTGHNDNSPAARQPASTDDSDGYANTGNTSGTQRRTLTLSNGEVIWDFVGNVWEWVDDTTTGVGTIPGLTSDTTDVYKSWTAAGMQQGSYAKVFPGYGSLAAAQDNWDNGQGLGKMITNYNATNERGFIMGGAYTTGYINSGLFTLRLNYTPGQASSTTGFRASFTP